MIIYCLRVEDVCILDKFKKPKKPERECRLLKNVQFEKGVLKRVAAASDWINSPLWQALTF